MKLREKNKLKGFENKTGCFTLKTCFCDMDEIIVYKTTIRAS